MPGFFIGPRSTLSGPIPLAATVMLLRDGAAGLEVLMITRHAETAFAGGALVFPGGRQDEADTGADIIHSCRAVLGTTSEQMAVRVCGIRETFEEARVLLARRHGSEELIDNDERAEIESRLTERLGRAPNFTELVVEGGIELATDLLVPFAHWITPRTRPRRYDTHFFLAPAPARQEAQHDGHEAVASVWVSPGAAAADGEAKRVKMLFATRFNLLKLAHGRDTGSALAMARANTIVTVCPEYRDTPEGRMWCIPIEAGYGVAEMPVGSEAIA